MTKQEQLRLLVTDALFKGRSLGEVQKEVTALVERFKRTNRFRAIPEMAFSTIKTSAPVSIPSVAEIQEVIQDKIMDIRRRRQTNLTQTLKDAATRAERPFSRRK